MGMSTAHWTIESVTNRNTMSNWKQYNNQMSTLCFRVATEITT